MKTPGVGFCALLTIVAMRVSGQGSFQNFNFESSLIEQTHPSGLVNVSDAIPGWTAYVQTFSLTTEVSQISFNDPSPFSLPISLQGATATNVPSIQGGFSLLLQGGTPFPGLPVTSWGSIAQTGAVPTTAQSIRFLGAAGVFPQPGPAINVFLGGKVLNLVTLGRSGDIYTMGADVSAYAGQTVELRFSAPAPPPGVPPLYANIDSIEFSELAIPEPRSVVLLASGLAFLLFRHGREPRVNRGKRMSR